MVRSPREPLFHPGSTGDDVIKLCELSKKKRLGKRIIGILEKMPLDHTEKRKNNFVGEGQHPHKNCKIYIERDSEADPDVPRNRG